MQINGENYLVPIDAQAETQMEAEVECLKATRFLAVTEEKCRVNILILDACRDNPLPKSNRSTGDRGLAVMNAPAGSIIAYAADANQTASDGEGENGLYTQELLKNMLIPNLSIEDVFKRTRIGVLEKSGNRQKPAEYSSLVGDFYFITN